MMESLVQTLRFPESLLWFFQQADVQPIPAAQGKRNGWIIM